MGENNRFRFRVFVVQAESGEILAAKATHYAALTVARLHAPARVVPLWADKIPASQPPTAVQEDSRLGDRGFDGSVRHPLSVSR
jgi:hypothetical protein